MLAFRILGLSLRPVNPRADSLPFRPMHTSVRWLNRLLSPATLTPEEAESVLMDVGFPIETKDALPDGDTHLDVEITSNRGDCLSHIGLAREVAARTGRALALPAFSLPAGTGSVNDHLKVDNRTPEVCPLFTARVVKGVKIGPSPAWLVSALEAVGQRSINNVVDATNYVNFEYGQPSHAFDLNKLDGKALVIRFAKEGEKLTTLDGKPRVLKSDELVVADASRAQSLAGVIGGQDAEVTASTTDVVLEAATWDPVTIRRAARRLQIRTDAGYRFERVVDPRTIRAAADRLAALVIEVAGGQLAAGIIEAGQPAKPLHVVTLRAQRCRDILGSTVTDDQIVTLLHAHGITTSATAPGVFSCTIPPHRVDLTREIDLIEEVARTRGLSQIPLLPKLGVTVRAPQPRERAQRELVRTLTSLGFYETVTFSFVKPTDAQQFLPKGAGIINVDDDRRGAEPTLRPSTLPNLLQCRRANQDGQVSPPGGVRLFELAAIFASAMPGAKGLGTEKRALGLLCDVPGEGTKRSLADKQNGVRLARGAIESVVRAMGGVNACLEIIPGAPAQSALDPAAAASITLHSKNGPSTPIGFFGLVSKATLERWGLDVPVAVAELDLEPLLALYPPKSTVSTLPTFPGIERDLSLVLADDVPWAKVAGTVGGQKVHLMEGFDYVYTYRGKPLNPGTKSVTLRLKFRDPARTLRHEEVDPQVAQLVEVFKRDLGATLRA